MRGYFDAHAQKRVEWLSWLVGLAGSPLWWMSRGEAVAGAWLLGVAGAWLNFRWLRRLVAWVADQACMDTEASRRRRKRKLYRKLLLRYALLFVPVCAMLSGLYWPVVAFLCGLLTVPVVAVIEIAGEFGATVGHSLRSRMGI